MKLRALGGIKWARTLEDESAADADPRPPPSLGACVSVEEVWKRTVNIMSQFGRGVVV